MPNVSSETCNRAVNRTPSGMHSGSGPSRSATFREDCLLCTLAPAGGFSTVYVDDVAIALVESGHTGASLAPRSHVGSLSDLGQEAGPFLAALRRVANMVQAAYRTTGTMIEPTTSVEGAPGHVTYRIVPTIRNGVEETTEPESDAPTPVEEIEEALGRLGSGG
jgi:hypothetical protein